MSSRFKKITIYDVAERAGVAISTVSRVLNSSPNVSEDTRRKVDEAIKELRFRPQVSARHLASRKPQMLAIAVPSFTTPFYNEVLKGVKDEIQEMDLDIIIYNTGSKNPAEAVENFFDRGTADAVIVISIEISDNVDERLQSSGIPAVLIATAHPSYDYFELNDYKGGYMAAEHLIGQGYSRLGAILPAIATQASRERLRGFKQALLDHRLPVSDSLFVSGHSTKHAGFTEEAGFEAIYEFQKRGEFPEALFALNDTQAVGALYALSGLGMKVPEDIAIMGYDNIKLSRYLDLTTIDQQMHSVGIRATKRLSEIIKNPDLKPMQTTLDPVLVPRNSTRKAV
ncbi:MAG: LacI family DNA-binding transcriptional regulator [Balneolaceae bacterium]